MILLVDGGSTKSDWCLVDRTVLVKRFSTKGMNPFFRSGEDIREEIEKIIVPFISDIDIEAVHFFGAGCISPDMNRIINDAIAANIKTPVITVDSDLLAVARGFCGKDKGIAGILGTGSNSCYYDGEKIVEHVSPLGFILGDEGSGAVLGRTFIGACLKNQLTEVIKEKFLNEINLTPAEILNKVYKESMPNRFLASISPFILNNIENECIYELVYNCFKDFFVKNVMQYDYKNFDVHLSGSVAFHYADILRKVGADIDIHIGKIVQSPMQGLIEYYSKK